MLGLQEKQNGELSLIQHNQMVKQKKSNNILKTCAQGVAYAIIGGLLYRSSYSGESKALSNFSSYLKHKGEAPGPFHWKRCSSHSDPNYLCGYLTVPLDYTNSSDPRRVDIATTLYQAHPGRKSKRTVVVEPGGPGGSGTNLIWRKGKDFSDSFTDGEFDVLGFDPRGVNLTNPAISCFSKDAYRDRWAWVGAQWPEVRGYDALVQEDAMNEAIFAACEETWGDIPRFLTTAFVARDVESIREALGEDELTGFVISYGTGIGQTYAQMFPDRVGRLVLDGCEFVLDHREKWGFGETSLDNVTAAFEDGFVGECVKAGPAGCALATSASIEEADYKKAQAALSSRIHNLFDEIKRRPAPGFTHQAGPGIVTYERLIGMLYQSLYDPGSWGKTAEVFKELEAGNATLALQAMNAGWSYDPELAPSKGKQGPYPGHYSLTHPSSSELSRLVICGDAYDGEDKPIEWWSDLHSQMVNKSFVSGTPRLYTSLPCRHFKWKSAEVYRGNFTASLKNPLLLIGESYDPATPLRNARRLQTAMGYENARLIHHHGYGHSSTRDISNCTNSLVRSLILHGKSPVEGETNCYANKKPFPPEGTGFQIEDYALLM